jgi:hypothetical protein
VVRGLDENADEEMLRYEFAKYAPVKVGEKISCFALFCVILRPFLPDLHFYLIPWSFFSRISALSEIGLLMYQRVLHLFTSIR